MKDINNSKEIEKVESEVKDETVTTEVEEKEVNNAEINTAEEKSGSRVGIIITVIAIVVILSGFAGAIYYNNVYLPQKKFEEKLGYNPSKYVKPFKYTGLDYEITQKDFDASVNEETHSYDDVNRAAKKGDQIDFSYTGYVNGKKDKNISFPDAQIIIGKEKNKVLKAISEAVIGHKKGETVTVKDIDATEITNDKSDYSKKKADIKVKIKNVGELVIEKVSDKWVNDSYGQELGIVNKKDFYNMIENSLEDTAKENVWKMALKNTSMTTYPQEVYNDVVDEFNGDAQYRAKEYNMKPEEYLFQIEGYTNETLNDEYNTEVKSVLLMWYIVNKEDLKCSNQDIENKYEEFCEELGYDSVEKMKKDYSRDEMEEAVFLQKSKDFVYNHSNIKKSYKIPK